MSNPLWIPGAKSANPAGRPKNSVRTVKGMIERFLRRNLTPTKLQRMYNTLSVKDQVDMLLQLLPYAQAKLTAETLSREEIERIYEQVDSKLREHGKEAV